MLSEDSRIAGDAFLASKFGVQPWSAEFFEINFFIVARIDELKGLISDLSLDDDFKEEHIRGLSVLSEAFGPNGHRNEWRHSVSNYITPATIAPLSALSGMLRPLKPYPRLDDGERDELLGQIDQLLSWLEAHQLAEQDFIRQALIDGLKRFRFRVERLHWVGWGYTLESLREVIGAYFALLHGTPRDGSNTSAEAMLKLISDFVRSFYDKTKFAKEMFETGEFMLKAYGATTLIGTAIPQVAGLLT